MDFGDDLFDDDLFEDDFFEDDVDADADAVEEFYDGEMEGEEEPDFFADEMVFGDEEDQDLSFGPDLYGDGDGEGDDVGSVGYCAAADDEWESDQYVEDSWPEMEYGDEENGEVYLSDDSDDVLGLGIFGLGYGDDDEEEEEPEVGDGVPSLGLDADDELGVDRLDWLDCESDYAGGSLGSLGLDSDYEDDDDDGGEVDLNSDAEMEDLEDSEYLNCVDSPGCWEEELGWEEADVGVEGEPVVSSELHLYDDGGSELHVYGEVEYYDDGLPHEWDFHLASHSVAADEFPEGDDFMAMDLDLDLDLDGVFFEQFVDDELINGSPPAAKSVIARLPMVCLTQSHLDKNITSCAVCTEEFSVRENVRKLPCSHHYHGECIIPWLKMRNTCPVCRFELPSDDPSYEGWKAWRAADSDVSGEPLESSVDALIID